SAYSRSRSISCVPYTTLFRSLTEQDVLYLTLPCYHNNAVTVCWSAALAGGAAIALRRKFSARAFWKDVQFFQATCFGYIGELCRDRKSTRLNSSHVKISYAVF